MVNPGNTPNDIFLRLLASPNIASKRWVHRQYDQSVLSNTVVEAGSDAAVMRIKGTPKGIALTTDGNGRYCYINPYAGGAMAVAEAARNIVCAGAHPVAVTDCLNFGNPERPEVYYQMQEVIRGIADACAELGTPVISGNVSLYNETEGRADLSHARHRHARHPRRRHPSSPHGVRAGRRRRLHPRLPRRAARRHRWRAAST